MIRFDVGVILDTNRQIPLYRIIQHDERTYPMFTTLGCSYGSINFKYKEIRIKAYPRMVHLLKGHNQTISMKAPINWVTLLHRRTTLDYLQQNLYSYQDWLSGLWIEACISARTIREAFAIARAHRLLTMEFILEQVGDGGTRMVPIQHYLDHLNINWDRALQQLFVSNRNSTHVTVNQ